MTSYPVQLWGEMQLRRRSSTSSQTLPSWFGVNERTVAWTVSFGPQVPFRMAVESSYFCGFGLFPPISVPNAKPRVVRTFVQSRPSVWPFSHWRPSEIGFSAREKLVVYGPCILGGAGAGNKLKDRVARVQVPTIINSMIADSQAITWCFRRSTPIGDS